MNIGRGSDERLLAEGGYLSDVVEPASGELVTGLAWPKAAKSATHRRRILCIFYYVIDRHVG